MRRVRRRGGNKEKVFGCDLLEHLAASSQEIPQVLKCCSEFVEHNGIVDGIYRLSGVSSNIQKLRGEFESDGNADLNKDLYLQDIHCVSSLCKAYFRELPNPLLTYQLYDKFAEAVALQLEEERLVKIRDVLQELPSPHYRTLEFLMRHLVRMASYCSETNMHARNLAIVWAPNLLRSKDIEATGFNGTAAFMEVRVQSIVVEFILTHVPQLFPDIGLLGERRKSLPSPSVASNQEEAVFKPAQLDTHSGISPRDASVPIPPYHSIIEGTDKRKGSLKGRKWMSIFNIGGRFPDPRRRHKHSAKEKDRSALRPARSMDSLSIQSYQNEGARHPAQPPASTSPLVTSSSPSGPEAAVPPGGMGGSEYAVTYRRGTGLVSGGTQGTYTALDPEGLGATGSEGPQSRSPGISTKAGRRAAMHITGPTMVTVPLHITSNLALGVLQGRGSDRIIHRGREKEGGDKVEGKEGEGSKVKRKESKKTELKGGGKAVAEKTGQAVDVESRTVVGEVGEGKVEETKVKEKKEEEGKQDGGREPERVAGGHAESQRAKSCDSITEDEDAAANNEQQDDGSSSDYIDMNKMEAVYASDILNSTQADGDDQELFGYVQDNFEFLDHMDCSSSYQVNEFSVEPPGHSDDEYEVMVQAQCHRPAEPETIPKPGHETRTMSQSGLNPHRPLSLDLHSRHTKSLSLPYMTSPVLGPEESCSEEEEADVSDDEDDDDDYSSGEEESLFMKSLPADFILTDVTRFEVDTVAQESRTLDGLPVDQAKSSEETEPEPETKAPSVGEQQEGEVMDGGYKEGPKGEQIMKKEEEDTHEEPEDTLMQSDSNEEDFNIMEDVQSDGEKPPAAEESARHEELSIFEVEERKEVADSPHTDNSPCPTESSTTQETGDVPSEESRENPCNAEDTEDRHDDEGEDRSDHTETICQETDLGKVESDEKILEDSALEGEDGVDENKYEGKMQDGSKEQDSAVCIGGIWEELEEVVCEVIEDKENEQGEKEGDAGRGDVGEVGEGEEEHSGENMEVVKEGGMNKTDVRIEVEQQLLEITEDKPTYPEKHLKFEKKEISAPDTSELQEAMHAANEEGEERQNDRESVDSDTERLCEKEDDQVKDASCDIGKLKSEKSSLSQRGGGGVDRKLVISKNPKVYQVKAVPIVPPKPQHCKITALTLRQQQQQQRERRDRGNPSSVSMETDRDCPPSEQARDGGEAERRRDRMREGDEGAARDPSRNSPLSMCFDKAVAIATMKREKERECEKERQRDWGNEVQ